MLKKILLGVFIFLFFCIFFAANISAQTKTVDDVPQPECLVAFPGQSCIGNYPYQCGTVYFKGYPGTDNPSVCCNDRKICLKFQGVLCEDGDSVKTAIGCIPINNTSKLVAFILGWSIGIAGGITFLLIVLAGFQIITSAGDPKRLQAGRELLTSAIGGLIFLIFSAFSLRVISVNILGIF